MFESVMGAAPASLTLGDIYPEAAREWGTPATGEKTNPTEPVAKPTPTGQAIDVVSGATGLPPVVVALLFLAGLLALAKILTEKLT